MRRHFLSLALLAAMLVSPLFQVIAGKQKVACVGNSITYGYLVENRETNSYPAQLARMLGDAYDVVNFGKSRSTLVHNGHFPYFDQPEYTSSVEFAPDIVVIHLGINDTDPRNWPNTRDNFVADYLRLVKSYYDRNHDVRVIIANLSPLLAKHPRFKSGTWIWRQEIRDVISHMPQLIKELGVKRCELIDFGALLRDYERLLPDGIHPNVQGATIMAEYVNKVITGDFGGLSLPPVYGNGMVLQRYRPIHIQGTANAGDCVTVRLGAHSAKAVAGVDGQWSVNLPSMREGTGYTLTVATASKTIDYKDVAIGEVWIASGQSNMAFTLNEAVTARRDIPQCADSQLRFFDMLPLEPTNNIKWRDETVEATNSLKYLRPTGWAAISPVNAGVQSAVAYYFAKALRDSLRVPVGVIFNAVGGSTTESWVDVETLEASMPEALLNWLHNDYTQPWAQQRAIENVGDGTNRHPYEPSYLFASGVRPLGKYTVAGVIWYQGESNAHNIELHECLFELVEQSWRREFENAKLPFYFVQLSSIERPTWPQFRDSQRRLAQRLPYTWMAVSSDHGNATNVHPTCKQPVGERLARQALHNTYSFTSITPSGPLPAKATLAGDEVVVDMLYADGLTTADGKAPAAFEVGEIDGWYLPAKARIENNKIILSDMEIKKPQFVRYAWQPVSRGNVVNGDSLPASTFKVKVEERSDNECGVEAGLSGCFGTVIGNSFLRAGGCNFPQNPLAKDSEKKFYSGIYLCDTQADGTCEWTMVGRLPEPIAYGAAACVKQGAVLVGGVGTGGSLKTANLLKIADGKAELTALPALPFAIDNASACASGNVVYIVGGNADGKPSNKALCLDIDNAGKGWTELKAMPGNNRVQPVAAVAANAKDEPCLWIWGGFAGGTEPTLNCDGLCYNIKKEKWTAVAAPVDDAGNEVSTGGGVASALPDGRIAVVGGVNKDVFLSALRALPPDYLSHDIAWYKFNPWLLVFDAKAGKWQSPVPSPETARAGAIAVADSHNNALWVYGGELKPRIRTAETVRVAVK